MLKKILKYLLIGSGSLAAIVVIIGTGMYYNIIRVPIQLGFSHASWSANYNDDKILMGGSHNVFVGKVIEQIGDKSRGSFPETQFSVEVLYNIKGNLNGEVVINQDGGYSHGTLSLMEGHSLLTPGATYLFSTRVYSQEGWYTLNSHPNASKLISTDVKLNNKELIALIQEDKKIKSFEIAYPNEILEKSDITRNTTHNSFQSLPMEAKAAAVARADAARASLGASTQ